MAKPKITLQTVKTAVDLGKEVIPFVAPATKEYVPPVADQAQKKAKQTVESLKDSAHAKIQKRKDAKEQQKTREEARKKAVLSSLPPIPADVFFKNFEDNVTDSDDLSNGYMAITGCYAILTLKSTHEKDLSAYKDVYVGCGTSVGFSVYSHFRGFGNVDVYADFKFKEPMKVLIYPCDDRELECRFASLVKDLQAANSYNERDLLTSHNNNEQAN